MNFVGSVLFTDLLCSLWFMFIFIYLNVYEGFPGGSEVKYLPANAGDVDSVPGWGRSPGVGNGNHSSILAWRNPMDRGPWRGYSP